MPQMFQMSITLMYTYIIWIWSMQWIEFPIASLAIISVWTLQVTFLKRIQVFKNIHIVVRRIVMDDKVDEWRRRMWWDEMKIRIHTDLVSCFFFFFFIFTLRKIIILNMQWMFEKKTILPNSHSIISFLHGNYLSVTDHMCMFVPLSAEQNYVCAACYIFWVKLKKKTRRFKVLTKDIFLPANEQTAY